MYFLPIAGQKTDPCAGSPVSREKIEYPSFQPGCQTLLPDGFK